MKVFVLNLERMRKVADIKTICAHGSPLSPFSNMLLWKNYDYRNLGIIGEPYIDIDRNEWGYFSDTGRKWSADYPKKKDIKFKNTQDVINHMDNFPDKIIITIHPERWMDDLFLWCKQLAFQNAKNIVKRFLVSKR